MVYALLMDTFLKRQSGAVGRLARLAHKPPASLLLEGGSQAERRAMSLFWAAAVNCTALSGAGPCGACPACVQMQGQASRDLFFFDFSAGPWKDVIDELREARRVLGEPPREGARRVVALFEVQGMLDEHANLLLKSIEEPGPFNVFVLTAPQRERILPTLVSRSFVMTLAWPRPTSAPQGEGAAEDPAAVLAAAFYGFLATGRGLFAHTGGKGKLDKAQAEAFVIAAQRDLAQALSGAATADGARFLAERLDLARLRRLDLLLDQARESLQTKVNPSLVVDWLAVTARGLAI